MIIRSNEVGENLVDELLKALIQLILLRVEAIASETEELKTKGFGYLP